MLSKFWVLACCAAVAIPSAVAAEDKPNFFEQESAILTKQVTQQTLNQQSCAKLKDSRMAACLVFYKDGANKIAERLRVLDVWQAAVREHDTAKSWEQKARYNVLIAEWREMARVSWQQDFFPQSWTVSKNTSKPAGYYYRPALQAALSMQDSVCRALPGERSVLCSGEFEQYVGAIREVLADSDKIEEARNAASRDRYLDAFVEEGRAIARLVPIQAKVMQKYYP